ALQLAGNDRKVDDLEERPVDIADDLAPRFAVNRDEGLVSRAQPRDRVELRHVEAEQVREEVRAARSERPGEPEKRPFHRLEDHLDPVAVREVTIVAAQVADDEIGREETGETEREHADADGGMRAMLREGAQRDGEVVRHHLEGSRYL